MKKKWSVLACAAAMLCLVLCVSALLASCAWGTDAAGDAGDAGAKQTQKHRLGDVDGDTALTSSDVALLIRYLSGWNEDIDLAAADMDENGRINNRDAITLIYAVAFGGDFSELSGIGSENDPYLIEDRADIEYLSERVFEYADTRGVHFLQTSDIALDSGVSFKPVGTVGIPFEGVYDGGSHEITGLYINTSESFAGVFGFVTGTVKDLAVRGEINVHLNAAYSHSYAGGIAGAINNGAIISGCTSYVTLNADSYVGGIVGGICYEDDYLTDGISRIEDCTFRGELACSDAYAKNEAAMYFGGIVGRANGAIKNCTNYGKITVSGTNCRYIGGIAGFTYYSTKTGHPTAEQDILAIATEGCKNYGAVVGRRDVGGIVGVNAVPIINCENEGDVSGTRCIGGVAGVVGTSASYPHGINYVKGCKNSGKVALTEQYGGGITGYTYLPIYECENSGEIAGGASSSRIGGICGYAQANVSDSKNNAGGTVRGNQGIAGIVGWLEKSNSTIFNCHNYAPITSATKGADSYHIGGVCGMLGSTNSALSCTNEGKVTGGGDTYDAGIGGICGSIYSGSVVSDCVNRGEVTGVSRIGGIAGFGKMSTASYVRSCKNYGTVKSTRTSGAVYLGGIFGRATSGNIVDCTNYGTTPTENSSSYISKTVGSKSGTTTVSNTKSEV